MEIDKQHRDMGLGVAGDRNPDGTHQTAGGLTTPRSPECAEQQRRLIAVRMGSLAAAGHHAAGDLEEQFPSVARYLRDAATGFEHISSLLNDPQLDTGNLGGKQPVAIVAGVVLIGLGLAWFLTSSGDRPDRSAVDGSVNHREGGDYGLH